MCEVFANFRSLVANPMDFSAQFVLQNFTFYCVNVAQPVSFCHSIMNQKRVIAHAVIPRYAKFKVNTFLGRLYIGFGGSNPSCIINVLCVFHIF